MSEFSDGEVDVDSPFSDPERQIEIEWAVKKSLILIKIEEGAVFYLIINREAEEFRASDTVEYINEVFEYHRNQSDESDPADFLRIIRKSKILQKKPKKIAICRKGEYLNDNSREKNETRKRLLQCRSMEDVKNFMLTQEVDSHIHEIEDVIECILDLCRNDPTHLALLKTLIRQLLELPSDHELHQTAKEFLNSGKQYQHAAVYNGLFSPIEMTAMDAESQRRKKCAEFVWRFNTHPIQIQTLLQLQALFGCDGASADEVMGHYLECLGQNPDSSTLEAIVLPAESLPDGNVREVVQKYIASLGLYEK